MKKSNLILLIMIATTSLFAQNPEIRTVSVRGEGIVRVVPDEATINVRVEHSGENPKELKSQNDAVIRQILQFVKKSGIADKDVSTQYMNLSKNYDYNTKTYSFAANQSLSIKLRNLDKYEQLMNGLMETGLNRIDGIAFSSSKKELLEAEARRKAMQHAQMKAEEYASVLNQKIGKAVVISEFADGGEPRPMLYKMAAMSDASYDEGASIAPGEMEIRTTVNVVFELQ